MTGPDDRQRSVPVALVVLVALMAGWVMGSLLAPESSPATPTEVVAPPDAPRPTPEPPTPEPPTPEPPTPDPESAEPSPSEPTQSEAAGEKSDSAPRWTVVVADLPGADRGPSTITITSGDSVRTVLIDRPIAAPTQSSVGDLARRVAVADSTLLFIADRSVMALDLGAESEPVRLADASALFTGPDPKQIWAQGVEPHQVVLITLADPTVRVAADLSQTGIPVASYRGGIVVARNVDQLDQFALWSPIRGVEQTWTAEDETTFVDAAANVLILQNSLGLASYNTVTDALIQSNRIVALEQLSGAFVSPRGRLLAVVQQMDLEAVSAVEVIDVQTGATVDEFNVAAPWLMHWVNDDEMLYLDPVDESNVIVRNVMDGSESRILELDGPAAWVAVTE